MLVRFEKTEQGIILTLPNDLADHPAFASGDFVYLASKRSSLVITHTDATRYNIEEMVATITEENRHPEVDWGPPVGKEILPNEIFYGNADATLPQDRGPGIIAHVCNDVGQWGKGFVLPLGKRYPEAEKQYREWARRRTEPPFALGQVQFVEVAPTLWVANMIGQHGIARRGSLPPVRYEAIRECLRRVCAFAAEQKAYVQMPRIGCGLAGGKWEEVSRIIEEELIANGVQVTVYDLPL